MLYSAKIIIDQVVIIFKLQELFKQANFFKIIFNVTSDIGEIIFLHSKQMHDDNFDFIKIILLIFGILFWQIFFLNLG